jgi:SAM-dependent methyltransferase
MKDQMKNALEFYNVFDKKLIDDYIYQNARIESAITSLGSFIPENSKHILDIGCGLGWSSHEFSIHFKEAKVLGIDFSPVLVDTAQKLFNNQNLEYKVFDITKELPSNKYDVIIMMDVYEHIPVEERHTFHESVSKILNENGRLILACPSKFHQEWLRNNNREGLQPVDEDVDVQTILDIAKDIKGEVIYFSYQKIWRSFDYLYAVIEINPQYLSKSKLKYNTEIITENIGERIKRVKENLNLIYDNNKKNKDEVILKKILKKVIRKFI